MAGLKSRIRRGGLASPSPKSRIHHRGGLPGLRSRREEKRVRRELERTEIVRRVEEMILGGEPSARRMIEDVLKPRPLSRGNAGRGRTRAELIGGGSLKRGRE